MSERKYYCEKEPEGKLNVFFVFEKTPRAQALSEAAAREAMALSAEVHAVDRALPMTGGGGYQQILNGSFSAVSKPIAASNDAFFAFFEIYKICILLHRFCSPDAPPSPKDPGTRLVMAYYQLTCSLNSTICAW